MIERIVNRIKKLENAHLQSKAERMIFKKELMNPNVPEWAKDAYAAYKSAGYNFEERGHSMDFYRIITLLHQKKIL
ncbi:hypothetical protein CIB87_10875 [Priestia megaterium]|uniref:Uncharacterized protein n=1 Tax=Priestia megaterium TaxID=1404 RepID=A0AA86LXX2_PRIMG|nr:hypothetical protein [Priestia megaterium]AXI29488.1 hypothetical protein CIB87_10875 [Priestia megaterium]